MAASLTVTELLARIESARKTPTLYLLGRGGFLGNEPGPHPMPGKMVMPSQELQQMKTRNRKKYGDYVAAAQSAHIDLSVLPPSMPACDCSGFVTWVLDLARAPSAAGPWINTDSIFADATGTTARFKRHDSNAAPLSTRVGAMLVFPKDSTHEVGHIGFVTQVDAAGRPTRLVHCAPQNFLVPPAPGAARTAILETAPDVFFQAPQTIAVWSNAVAP
ncbi:MAG: CHAP domain-containing protein [Burkholderiaceae bacterium]